MSLLAPENGISSEGRRWIRIRESSFGRALGLLGACGLIACILFQTGWLVYSIEKPLKLKKIRPEIGKAYSYATTAPFPDDFQGNHSTLILLENGVPLPFPHSMHQDIREKGTGRYSHWTGVLFFSTTDGTDPRFNGRSYSMVVPRLPATWLWVACGVLFAAFFHASWLSYFRRAEAVPPFWIAIGLVVLALGFRLYVGSSQPFIANAGEVKGMPFSDGRAWYELAHEFALGEGWGSAWECWGARRPFFYVFMGALMALTGPSVSAVHGIHLVLGVVGVVMVFDLCRRIIPLPIAAIAAAFLCFDSSDASQVYTTLSEPLGCFFSIAFLWTWVWAAERSKGVEAVAPLSWSFCLRHSWAFGLSGLFLALANLTRPLNLPAVLVFPVVSLVVLSRGGALRRTWRMHLTGYAVFGLVVILALLPWLVRQRLVHGIWTISDNSAPALFAATDPRFGSWKSEAQSLGGHCKTIRERVDFFNAGSKENLRLHWRWYIGHVWAEGGKLLSFLRPSFFLLCVAWVLGCIRVVGATGGKRFYQYLLLLLVALLLWFSKNDTEHILWLACIAALLGREQVLYLVGVMASSLVPLAMLGMTGDPRFQMPLAWTATAIAAWGTYRLVTLGSATDGSMLVKAAVGIESDLVARWLGRGALLLLGLWVLGLSLAIGRHVFAAPPPPIRPTLEEEQRWVELVLSNPEAEPYRAYRKELKVYLVDHRDGRAAYMVPKDRIEHWARVFTPRPYPFAVITAFRGCYGGYATFPGKVPDLWRKVVLIGFEIPSGETWFETIALSYDAHPDEATIVRPPPEVIPEHVKTLAKLLPGAGGSAAEP